MVQNHNLAFWSKSTGMFISSSDFNKPYIFLKMIKKSSSGVWEGKEGGKNIKISLTEMIQLIDTLKDKSKRWKTFHSFKNRSNGIEFKTAIEVNWSHDTLWFNIGVYKKSLAYPETTLLLKLLEHILEEKIEKATIPSIKPENT